MTEQVRAMMNYLVPGSPVNRRFVAPGEEINTGSYEPREVLVTNARSLEVQPTMTSHGFELIRHTSGVTDFTDRRQLDDLYVPEAVEFIRQKLGADLVVPMGWMTRMGKVEGRDVQPPAADVHVDIAPKRGRAVAERMLKVAGKEDLSYSRFLISSFWRVFSEPPQDWPLALCAGDSVRDDEGESNVMINVEELPQGDEVFAPIPGEENLPAATVFPYSADHQWFYYPDMTRDEALLFEFFDSRHGPSWRVPHTAFEDHGVRAAITRKSIELRSVAYWLNDQ